MTQRSHLSQVLNDLLASPHLPKPRPFSMRVTELMKRGDFLFRRFLKKIVEKCGAAVSELCQTRGDNREEEQAEAAAAAFCSNRAPKTSGQSE